jgi:hypothetical protein
MEFKGWQRVPNGVDSSEALWNRSRRLDEQVAATSISSMQPAYYHHG